MSGYLAGLVRRARGETSTLRPLTPPLFAPSPVEPPSSDAQPDPHDLAVELEAAPRPAGRRLPPSSALRPDSPSGRLAPPRQRPSPLSSSHPAASPDPAPAAGPAPA